MIGDLQTPRARAGPCLAMAACLLGAAVCLAQGCRCGQRGSPVARVARVAPVTEIALGGDAWVAAAVDDRLALGDALRTGERGEADLEILGYGRIHVRPGALVRFTSQPGGAKQLGLLIEDGALEAAVGSSDAPLLILDGQGGRTRLAAGSKAELVIGDGERLSVEVSSGQAEVEEGGRVSKVVAGRSYTFGGAPARADAGTDAAAAGPADDAGTAAADASDPAADADVDEELSGVGFKLLQGGRVEIRAPGDEEFKAPEGRHLVLPPGTAIKVTQGSVEIQGPSGAAVVFRDGASGVISGSSASRLAVRLGGGTLEARSDGGSAVVVDMPGGQAETAAGGVAAFLARTLSKTSSRVNVTSGLAVIRAGGETAEAETGAEVVLDARRSLSVSQAEEVRPVLPSGSAVVHDPQREGGFTIRFQPIDGCAQYRITVRSKGMRSVDAVTSQPRVSLNGVPYGSFDWEAACLRARAGDVVPADTRSGRITRVADRSGNVRLPTTAPQTSLETDGRRYVVTYQNKLPAITLRWARAAPASSYQLEVFDDDTGARVHSSTGVKASRGFRSGFFRDGSYYWFFRAVGATERAVSPVTKLSISFDNVLPAINIIEPREGDPGGGAVRVRGVVAVGSSVSVNGTELQLTPDFRFDQQVAAGPGGLLIFRVSTPGRGSGIYLRHLR